MIFQNLWKGGRRGAGEPSTPVFAALPWTSEMTHAQIGSRPSLPDVPWFPPYAWRGLEKFRPRVIAGPRPSLRKLCRHVRAGNLDYSFLDTAVYCLTHVGERPLTNDFRDELWDVFGLPLFELFVGGDGQVLARECEAHDGWHVNESAAEFTKLAGEPHLVMTRKGARGRRFEAMGVGFSGDVTAEPCHCGLENPRLINLPTEELWQ